MKDHTSTTRRSFFRKAGAAVAVPLALGAGTAVSGTDGTANADADSDALRLQIRHLEDRDAVRSLHETFLRQLNSGRTEQIQTLFADPKHGRLHSSDGRSVMQLAADHEAGGETVIEITADGLQATAAFCCIAGIATAVAAQGTLADMMRIQGNDRLYHREHGVLEGRYLKVGGEWKIERIVYRRAS